MNDETRQAAHAAIALITAAKDDRDRILFFKTVRIGRALFTWLGDEEGWVSTYPEHNEAHVMKRLAVVVLKEGADTRCMSPILGEQFRGQPVYVTDAENLPFLRNHYGGELEYVWERP